jgi:predicted transcriptional regulator
LVTLFAILANFVWAFFPVRQRAQKEILTTSEVAGELGLSERMARNLLTDWVKDGWLQAANPSRRARAYSLSAKYRQYLGSLSAMTDGGKENGP